MPDPLMCTPCQHCPNVIIPESRPLVDIVRTPTHGNEDIQIVGRTRDEYSRRAPHHVSASSTNQLARWNSRTVYQTSHGIQVVLPLFMWQGCHEGYVLRGNSGGWGLRPWCWKHERSGSRQVRCGFKPRRNAHGGQAWIIHLLYLYQFRALFYNLLSDLWPNEAILHI